MASKDRIILPRKEGQKVRLITYTAPTKKARLAALAEKTGLTMSDLNDKALDMLLEKAVVKE